MSTTESVKSVPERPWPNGNSSTWVYLDDILTPPEVPPLVEAVCRREGIRQKKHKDSIFRERKLMFLFPGKEIVYKQADRGMLLLMVAEPLSSEIGSFLGAMSRSERAQVHRTYIFSDHDESLPA